MNTTIKDNKYWQPWTNIAQPMQSNFTTKGSPYKLHFTKFKFIKKQIEWKHRQQWNPGTKKNTTNLKQHVAKPTNSIQVKQSMKKYNFKLGDQWRLEFEHVSIFQTTQNKTEWWLKFNQKPVTYNWTPLQALLTTWP